VIPVVVGSSPISHPKNSVVKTKGYTLRACSPFVFLEDEFQILEDRTSTSTYFCGILAYCCYVYIEEIGMALGIIEQLTHSTVRIECVSANGQQSSGTGFFFSFGTQEMPVPLIVSNKHVIEGAKLGRLYFTFASPDEGKGPSPDTGKLLPIMVENFETRWIPHPDPNIDLAVMPIAGVLDEIRQRTGRHAFYVTLGPDDISSTEERQSYSTMEDVLMIGYPNGIWDQVNNLPVIRRGITASHVGTRWNGRDEFLIDVATFPGSSGSPVFLVNIGSYRDAMGTTYMGKTRVKLLGVNHSVMLHRADGVIEMVNTPTATVPIPVTGIPNNLGVALNSQRLLDFEAILNDKQREFEQRPQVAPPAAYPRKIY
jgi:hypothetical protein